MEGKKREGMEVWEGWRAEVEEDLLCVFRLGGDSECFGCIRKGFEAISTQLSVAVKSDSLATFKSDFS